MSEKASKETKKNWKLKNGNPGNPNGRPKGSKDKIPRTVKQNIEETFKKLGGIDGLVEWAEKSNRNKEKVYDWYFSMLPKNVDASVAGDLGLTIKRIITKSIPDND